MIRNVFWNPEERRIRFVWRMVGSTLLILFLSTIVALILIPLSELGAQAATGSLSLSRPPTFLRVGLATLLGYGAAVWLAGRVLDRRPFTNFGLHLDGAWWRDFGFGLALGALLITAIFLLELAAGWVTVTDTFVGSADFGFVPAILLIIGGFICIGIYEELVFRGYYLTNVAEWLNGLGTIGPRWGILGATVLTSIAFGLLHALNPNATAISTLNIVVVSIFTLSLGYILTGELAIPIGLHITWNFFQAGVFGFPVSGLGGGPTFIAIEQLGPTWLTGGAFGPEAGVLGLLVQGVGAILIWAWVRGQRGRPDLALEIAEPGSISPWGK